MELQTKVNISKSSFKINPTDRLLFVGSCFAENIGRRFVENQFDAIVRIRTERRNKPASVLQHRGDAALTRFPVGTLSPRGEGMLPFFANGDDFGGSILTFSSPLGERMPVGQVRAVAVLFFFFSFAIITLGTNHIYILKETGEIVDNCMSVRRNCSVRRSC